MATIEKFEDLDVWKQGMLLCSIIYEITNNFKFTNDFALKDQIRKSAISIPSNISEGFERESKNQFIYFLMIAKGSCGELRTQIKIAKSLNYLTDDEYEKVLEICLSISKQLSGFIKYLKEHKATIP
ncbi:MAG: four helix bundle protein [Bacteroidia bacterium]